MHSKHILTGFLLVLVITSIGCGFSAESKRDRFLARGKQLVNKGDYSRAILEFRNAMQATPKDPEPYFQIALASLASGDLPTGVASLRKTLEVDPKHSGAQLRLAQLMSTASDNSWVKEGETRLRELVAGSPDNPEALNSLAYAELRLGKTDQAIRTLEKALAAAPKQLSVFSTMAMAKFAAGDAAGAEAALQEATRRMPESSDARITLGAFYMARNRLPEAEAAFRKAVDLDKTSARAVFNLARLHNSTGRKKEAENEFQKASSLGDRDFKHIYGIFLFEEGRRDEAINEFERLYKADPSDRAARTRLIGMLRMAGRQGDAAKILAKSLEANPSDTDALTQHAEMLVETAEYSQAETELGKVLRLRPDSDEAHVLMARVHRGRGATRSYKMELSEALRLNPLNLIARLALVHQLLSEKEQRAASDLLNATPETQKMDQAYLVQRNWFLWAAGDMAGMRKGIDDALRRGRTPEILVQDGIWKLRNGKPEAARASVEEALKIDPSNVRAMEVLNIAYGSEKQGSLAIQKVKEYASKQPKSAPVQQFLGLMLLGSGDKSGARQAFEAAKSADSKFVNAELTLTQMDVVDGKWSEARRRLEAILAADKTNTTARMWLGNVHASTGDNKNAIEQYRQVVAADTSNAEAMNNLAYLLAENEGQPAEALKYAQKARELAPNNAEYADTLGWVFYRQGMYPMAIREFERITARTENPVWKYHLAMAYAKAGDTNRGKAALKAALNGNPNLPEAKVAQEMLGVPR